MLSQSDIITLNKGDALDHFLIVKKCELRTSKTNKQFLALELADKSISLNSNMFESFEEIYTKIKAGDMLKLRVLLMIIRVHLRLKLNQSDPQNLPMMLL